MNRRKFIQALSLLSASWYTTGCSSIYQAVPTKSKTPRIAVLGGGLAGLHAAYILGQKGYRPTLFEARNRLGGRVKTISNYKGTPIHVETGGEFIDSDHKDMLQLAKHFQLEIRDTFLDFKHLTKEVYQFNNKRYEHSYFVALYEAIKDKIIRDFQSCGADYDTPQAKKLDNMSISDYVSQLNGDPLLAELLNSAYTAEFGLETSQQSALNLIDLIGKENKKFDIFGESDERYKLAKGNSALVDSLSQNIQGDIHLDHILNSIVQQKDSTYTLSFDNRAPQVFDYLIITIPFSVLRTIQLDINLSEAKRNCIDTLGYGVNNKLFLHFDTRIWRDNGLSGFLFSDTIQNGWDAGHLQNDHKGATIYTAFSGGQQSLDLLNQPIDLDKYYQILESISGKPYHGKRASSKTIWSADPFSLGSYACYQPQQWSTLAGLEIEPVGNVFFAGEHCSDAFQGYMNGAAQTGRLAALNLINKIT